MVHICLSPQELFDPSTNVIDTLCIVGTINTYTDHFHSWVCKEVLSVALSSSSSSLYDPENEVDPVAPKKRKWTPSGESSAATSLLSSVLSTLKPSPDSGVSTEVWLPIIKAHEDDDKDDDDDARLKLVRVVLIVLPGKVSRHNAPSNPYGVTSMLKKHVRPNESTAIIPLVESSDHIRSAVCAIARVGGGLLYNRKTTTTTADAHSNNMKDSLKATSSKAPLLVGGISISETSIPSMNHLRVLFAPTLPISKDLQGELASLAMGIQLTRRLVDAPCNELHTTAFKEQALAVVHGMAHVTTQVIEGKDLEAKGYGALYGVGKAGTYRFTFLFLLSRRHRCCCCCRFQYE
jgi:hypothetical protein